MFERPPNSPLFSGTEPIPPRNAFADGRSGSTRRISLHQGPPEPVHFSGDVLSGDAYDPNDSAPRTNGRVIGDRFRRFAQADAEPAARVSFGPAASPELGRSGLDRGGYGDRPSFKELFDEIDGMAPRMPAASPWDRAHDGDRPVRSFPGIPSAPSRWENGDAHRSHADEPAPGSYDDLSGSGEPDDLGDMPSRRAPGSAARWPSAPFKSGDPYEDLFADF